MSGKTSRQRKAKGNGNCALSDAESAAELFILGVEKTVETGSPCRMGLAP